MASMTKDLSSSSTVGVVAILLDDFRHHFVDERNCSRELLGGSGVG